jgi:hypothetical protein
MLVALPLALVAACTKVPLLAPTGSVISLFPVATTISLNSEVDIIATVIENGQATGGTGATTTTRTGAGTPVQNGTLITFTTTIGHIEPAEARTHNGQVTVKLITGGTSGTATITAYSGGASTNTTLKVGTAAAKTVSVTTTPQSLGGSGGTVQVVASVVDDGGSPIGGVPVTFSTDKGSISPSTATTDTSGNATATLTTTATAKVTAAVGAITASATVNVSVRPMSSFTESVGATTAGALVTFTVLPTTGANLTNVRVDFGDGFSQDLGAISSSSNTSHAYGSPGVYTPSATARDASGDTQTLTTSLIVGSLPVTLTPSPASPTVDTPVTFAVGGTSAVQVDHYTFTLDDGTGPFATTSPQLVHSFPSKGPKNVRVDVYGVGGGKLGTAATAVDVQ